jgi:hypothetical protein
MPSILSSLARITNISFPPDVITYADHPMLQFLIPFL